MTILFDNNSINIHPPSYISKLSEDLLWLIFLMNTDDTEFLDPYYYQRTAPRPLETTRLSSQVCQKWRRILTQSSSIWGRLIDFFSFRQKSTYWRNEVLLRSETSLLWVFAGDLEDYQDNDLRTSFHSFFFELLSEHWARIEKICVYLNVDHVTLEGWSAIQLAAPNLVSFYVHSYNFPPKYSTFPLPIFANHAPRLKYFYTSGTRCNLDRGWMSNLRELTLGSQFSNEEVLQNLQLIPLLESLTLDSHQIIDEYRPPPVHLPHLRSLTVKECFEYARDIKPGPGCSFSFIACRDNVMADPFIRCGTGIEKLLDSYLSLHHPSYLGFKCSTYSFGVCDGHPFSTLSGFPKANHSFEFELAPNHILSNEVLEICLETFNTPHNSSVTDLELQVYLQPPLYSAFTKFALSFPALHCLRLSEYSIHELLKLDRDVLRTIFPGLQTLITLDLGSSEDDVPWKGSLERFLSLRNDTGSPIKILDLTQVGRIRLRDLEHLEAFLGLVVISEEKGNLVEYVCGSGRPETLRFYEQSIQNMATWIEG